MRPMYKSKAGSPTGSGQKAKSIIKRLESTCFRAFLVRVVIQHFLKTIVVQFVFEVIG